MDVKHFDLNDIENEPSDEQLASLMAAVAEEVKRKNEIILKDLMARLRAEIQALPKKAEGL